MTSQATPDDLASRLADLRENVAHLLAELATDDLEPNARDWFERDVADAIAEIDQICDAIQADADLIYTADGLCTPPSKSTLPKSERARVLTRLRAARSAFRGHTAKPDELRALAIRLRDAVRFGNEDPVALEAARIGAAMLARIDSDAAARSAIRMESLNCPRDTTVEQWRAEVAKAGFRTGMREYSDDQRTALDALVRRGVVTLRPQHLEHHRNQMVRVTHRRLARSVA